jgi:hypothetical protein
MPNLTIYEKWNGRKTKNEDILIVAYGDKVFCESYGDGIVIKYRKSPHEKAKCEAVLKGEIVTSGHILVRMDFNGAEMSYNTHGYRVGENGKLDDKSTLSITK